jgi:hypothetical protein
VEEGSLRARAGKVGSETASGEHCEDELGIGS